MTEPQKIRIDFYIEKLRKLPHYKNLMTDFSIDQEQAIKILEEYKEQYRKDHPKNVSIKPVQVTQPEFDQIKTKQKPKDFHEAVVQHGGAMVALRLICALVSCACAVRGFSVIVEINSSNIFYGIVSGVIFQGGSAILPVIAMMFFSSKTWKSFVIGLMFIIGGMGSMSYETYASVSSFHQSNVKQEILSSDKQGDRKDTILESIKIKIDQQLKVNSATDAQLAIRQVELKALAVSGADPQALAVASGRVQANLADQKAEAKALADMVDEQTKRMETLGLKSDSNSSALNLVGNQEFKNTFEFIIILIPSLMMVIFTSVFFGIALFGIHIRREK